LKYLLVTTLLTLSATCYGYTTDSGKISRVYVNPKGAIALQLDNGFPNANSNNECPSNHGWAGLAETDPVMKSAILAAKASGQSITVRLEGCIGVWIKIMDMYLN